MVYKVVLNSFLNVVSFACLFMPFNPRYRPIIKFKKDTGEVAF